MDLQNTFVVLVSIRYVKKNRASAHARARTHTHIHTHLHTHRSRARSHTHTHTHIPLKNTDTEKNDLPPTTCYQLSHFTAKISRPTVSEITLKQKRYNQGWMSVTVKSGVITS